MTNAFLSARCGNLIMANYSVNPELLKPWLPHGVELDFHNNKTYVSRVGFMFKETSLFLIPMPFLGTFACYKKTLIERLNYARSAQPIKKLLY